MSVEKITGAIWLPMTPEDYAELQVLLSQASPLVTGNYEVSDSFDLSEYLSAGKLGGVEFKAMFDRNLLSPLAELASGKRLAGSVESIRSSRVACACAAFCIMADILIEPSMALYEYGSTQGNSAALEDYTNFRIADNADPAYFIDVALGRADKIPAEHLSDIRSDPTVVRPSLESNFEKRLRLWRPNYLYVLKIAALRRDGLPPRDAVLEFQRWQAEESFYNAAASLYCIASASHQPPKGQMLKGINSPSAENLRRGLRNATWDICLIQQFGKYSSAPNEASWSLWSLDVAVRAIAKALLAREGQSVYDALADFYKCCWGRDGAVLHESYLNYAKQAKIGSDARRKATSIAFARIDDDICKLEAQLGISVA